jgi:hypothetical protein
VANLFTNIGLDRLKDILDQLNKFLKVGADYSKSVMISKAITQVEGLLLYYLDLVHEMHVQTKGLAAI